MNVVGAELRLKALASALSQPDRSHAALRRALVIWASEPEVVAPGRVPSGLAHAGGIADRNADLLRLFLPRAIAVIAAFPDRADDFPTPEKLRNVASQGPETGAFSDLPDYLRADLRDGLQALARSVERALTTEGGASDMRSDGLAEGVAEGLGQPAARHA